MIVHRRNASWEVSQSQAQRPSKTFTAKNWSSAWPQQWSYSSSREQVLRHPLRSAICPGSAYLRLAAAIGRLRCVAPASETDLDFPGSYCRAYEACFRVSDEHTQSTHFWWRNAESLSYLSYLSHWSYLSLPSKRDSNYLTQRHALPTGPSVGKWFQHQTPQLLEVTAKAWRPCHRAGWNTTAILIMP